MASAIDTSTFIEGALEMVFTNKTYKEKIISIYEEKLVPEIEGIALEIKSFTRVD